MDFGAGDIFGDTYVTDPNDTYPLLAHSGYSDTWPVRFNYMTGADEPYWPGGGPKITIHIYLDVISQEKTRLLRAFPVVLFPIWMFTWV